jgi:hypothetical protein
MGRELAPPVPRIWRLLGVAVLAVLALTTLPPAQANAGTSTNTAVSPMYLIPDASGQAVLVDPALVTRSG